MVKILLPGSKVGAKPRGSSGEGMLELGIDSCTTSLEDNTHTTIIQIEYSRNCCGL